MTAETKHVTLRWREGLVFGGGEADGPETTIDGDNATAPGPMVTLLLAAAACSGADVVSILRKMRVQLSDLRIDVSGERRDEEPKRFTAIHLEYRMSGEGLDEHKARRAIDLSLGKYCSVIHSLSSDVRITHALVLG